MTIKTPFCYIAIALGLPLLILLILSAPANPEDNTKLPLLTMLIISEFGAIVTAVGAFTGIKRILDSGINYTILVTSICCGLLSIKFLLTGITYWPL